MNRWSILTGVAVLTAAGGLVTASAAPSAFRSSSSIAHRSAQAASHTLAGPAAASQALALAAVPAAAPATHAAPATRSSSSKRSSQDDEQSSWTQRTLYTVQVNPITIPLLSATVVTIDGHPAADDARLYVLDITAAGVTKSVQVYAAGALKGTTIHEQLLNLPEDVAGAHATISYRYSNDQVINCAVKVDGAPCVNLPFDPANATWLLGRGMEGTLTVEVHALAAGIPVDATVPIPLVGQVLAIAG